MSAAVCAHNGQACLLSDSASVAAAKEYEPDAVVDKLIIAWFLIQMSLGQTCSALVYVNSVARHGSKFLDTAKYACRTRVSVRTRVFTAYVI